MMCFSFREEPIPEEKRESCANTELGPVLQVSDCKSLLFNVMNQVSQFAAKGKKRTLTVGCWNFLRLSRESIFQISCTIIGHTGINLKMTK